MDWVDRYVNWANRILGEDPITDSTEWISDWPEVEGPTPGLDRRGIIRALYIASPRRWRRMSRDFRWAQRQMVRMGRNPEDVRFLL